MPCHPTQDGNASQCAAYDMARDRGILCDRTHSTVHTAACLPACLPGSLLLPTAITLIDEGMSAQ